MSWSTSISGHVDTAEEEQRVIDALRTAISGVPGVDYAWVGTQFHQQVNLLAPPDAPQEVEQADSSTPHLPEDDTEEAVPTDEPAEAPEATAAERPPHPAPAKRAKKRPVKGR